jgi:hypothetical protein
MRNLHAWTARDQDHIKREVRVSKDTKDSIRWRFQAKRSDEAKWTYYDHPPIEDILVFIELLERKYQRRRASYNDILLAKKLLLQEQQLQSIQQAS